MKSVVLICSLLLLSACDHPFSTREPEKPVTSQSSWIPPHTPDDVLVNMIHAVHERNLENYMRCFADGSDAVSMFHFKPDPEAAALYPFLLNWTLAQEQNVLRQTFSLVPLDSSLSLTFPVTVRDVLAADSAVMVRQYAWSIHHLDDAMPTFLEGHAEIRMKENSVGEWVVYYWDDHAISDIPSFSLWKAAWGGS
ncbi:hypothetical protein JW948_00140 [bacterium]|nr:hypothetical protein [bacterium]